jgi:hypothetical protein
MRYPTTKTGTRDEFERDWYNAQAFGNKTSYGWHEGCDYNLKTGGDTDLGQPLYAIADGTVKYYHKGSHPTKGFGLHLVVEHDTPVGKRWVHYAHCQSSNFTNTVKEVKEGEKIAEVGKSGTSWGHLHFSILKEDPANLPDGIDTYAKTLSQLHDWWEDPTAFLNTWFAMSDNNLEPVNVETIINDSYLALTGEDASKGEMVWRLESWHNTKDLITSITADERFYAIYVQPQLEKQKEALESAHNKELLKKEVEWQSEMESAKKECEAKIKECEDKKFEDYTWYQLVEEGFKKMIGGWR